MNDDGLQDLRARIVADQDQVAAAVFADTDTVEALAAAQESCRECVRRLVMVGIPGEKALALVVGSVVEWSARAADIGVG